MVQLKKDKFLSDSTRRILQDRKYLNDEHLQELQIFQYEFFHMYGSIRG